MYDDEYENLNEEFKIVGSSDTKSHFYTSNEMFKNTTLSKDELSYDEMIGDPSRGKSIKNSRPAVYDIHSASSSVSSQSSFPSKRETRKVNVKVCPICSGPSIGVCNCSKQDSFCAKSHKWHVNNGKIILGHSH